MYGKGAHERVTAKRVDTRWNGNHENGEEPLVRQSLSTWYRESLKHSRIGRGDLSHRDRRSYEHEHSYYVVITARNRWLLAAHGVVAFGAGCNWRRVITRTSRHQSTLVLYNSAKGGPDDDRQSSVDSDSGNDGKHLANDLRELPYFPYLDRFVPRATYKWQKNSVSILSARIFSVNYSCPRTKYYI